jgi:RNA polymerase primary sigma factor
MTMVEQSGVFEEMPTGEVAVHDDTRTTDISRYYFRDIKKFPVLSAEEQSALVERAQGGDLQAREKLIGSNLGLVISVAKRYLRSGQPLADLIQDGNMGLIKAVEKFKSQKGACFSSYAVWWIRHAIVRALFQNARLIRLPVNVGEQRGRFIRTQRQLTQTLEREPEPHEIAVEMALSTEQITQMQALSQPPVSLDSHIGLPEDGNTLKDVIEDKAAISPVESLRMKRQKDQIRSLMFKLNQQERTVITMRFGLDGEKAKSLEAVGQRLCLNRDRVSRIENMALQKLRQNLSPDNTELVVSGRNKEINNVKCIPSRRIKARIQEAQRFLAGKAMQRYG